MDVAAYLQRFESSMNTFVGDDPLEQWDKFVELLLRKFPDGTSQLSLVWNRLVETFLNVEKYANDERFVNFCVKCASSYADPNAFYSHIFSKGVGRHSATLYVSWAQQLEQRNMNDHAEALYQKGIENSAQPTDYVLSEYRQFQSRTKCPIAVSGGRNPLQSSNSANIMTTRAEPPIHNKESVECQPAKPAERRYVFTVSRSENSGKLPPSSNENVVAAYDKEALQCEESELCFEEVRAQRYFQKIQEQQQQQEQTERQETTVFDDDPTQADINKFMKIKMLLEDIDLEENPGLDHHQPAVQPRSSLCLSTRTTLGLRLPSEHAFLSESPKPPEPEPEPSIDSRASATIQSLNVPVPTTNVSQHTPVLVPNVSHYAQVPALDLSLHIPVLPTSLSHHTPAAPLSHHTPVASLSHHAPASAASLSYHAPAPGASLSYHTPASAASLSYHDPASAASLSYHAPAPGASLSHHPPASAASLSHHAPAPGASLSHHAPASAASLSHHAPASAASLSYHAPASAASLSYHAPAPGASLSYHAPAPGASLSYHTPASAASLSYHDPASAASLSYHAPAPGASLSHHAPAPGASLSHHPPASAASLSHHAPAPGASLSHHAPASAASLSHHAPASAASLSYHAPASAASLSYHAPAPGASLSYHAPASAASLSHHAPAPGASLSHHESALLQGMASDVWPPDNDHKDNEDPLEPEHEANMSQGATANLSRITPNNSLGNIQATPSRVLPSPTVNTREALDAVMYMFQAPTLLEDPFLNASEEQGYDVIYTRNGPTVKPTATAPFTIFQDEAASENKENCSAPSAVSDQVKAVRALAELPKPNHTPIELPPDESTMWGVQFHAQNSLAACPNSTSDFAMLARFVSTPSTHKTPMSTANLFFPDQENSEGVEEEDAFGRRHTKKLSPIIEQSPSEEKSNNTAVTRQSLGSRQGTIVGEALAMNTQFMTTSCTTMVQPPPPAVLSFRDQTLMPHNASVHRSSGPGWEVYTSPEPKDKREPFTIMEDMEQPQPHPEPQPTQDIPMSPESAPRPDWLTMQSPEQSAEQDLKAFLTPHRPEAPHVSHLSQDVPMSPQVDFSTDAHMMSPDKDIRAPMDVSMNPKTPRRSRAGPVMSLVPDPWNDDLIAHLLAHMDPPLVAHTHCVTWQCNLPDIAPKMTLSMGNTSLRVDCVLGEGAFAKVYQATNPMTSDKVVLKVQKPANPWEFYINTQLDARVPPSMRHLYSNFQSAHIFNNGSVLLGEMHNYGTLLNAVNLYRTLGDKVMPQPLVLYFTVCILHMVEQLHSMGIVHADIKPDNFLLGKRFLENRGFDCDDLDHGLVLIDLGQSIDMRLFPEGTAFTAKCLTSGFQCTEMQTGKPWTYQTDYFGLAGTVYCMLFGTYMQVVNDGGVWRTNGVFRRNPHSDLWQEFFHTLLNVPDCGSLPDLRGLRHKLLSVLEQTYRTKVPSLKSRLVVLLLESSRKVLRR